MLSCYSKGQSGHRMNLPAKQGKKVLLVLNDGSSAISYNIKYKDAEATATLPTASVATYVW